MQELVTRRLQAGNKSPVKQVVWRWKQNVLIESLGDNKFKKLEVQKSQMKTRS
jgi:hypothetical protein